MKSFIKITLVTMFCLSSFSVYAASTKKSVKKETKKVEVDRDRVWTFNFEELSQLPASEKEVFTKSLVKEAQSNVVLKKIKEVASENSFKLVVASEEKWNSVATKINNYCQDSHNYSDCEKIAQIRVDLVIKNSTHR
ncbi:MAG: hypothetical protein H7235_05425 [Bdellovibrionaceae bacterium]|nr:hypothetical protein [Pseudobdellovibrionaceae bacterium]